MISKTQQTELTFHAIETKDILAMISLMDRLVEDINERYKYLEEHKESPDDYWVREYNREFPQLLKQYKILSTLGFISAKELNEEIDLFK